MDLFANTNPDHQVLIGMVAQSLGISEMEVTQADIDQFCAHTGWADDGAEKESLGSNKE